MIPANLYGSLNIPLQRSKLVDQTRFNIGPNLARVQEQGGLIPIATLQEIWRFILDNYAIPQMLERRPYEAIWSMLWDAYRMRLKLSQMKLNEDQKEFVEILLERAKARGLSEAQISDTIIFDTVDRMASLTHFISWKDGCPIQFNKPRYFQTPLEDRFYSPTKDRFDAMNAVHQWNIQKNNVYIKQMMRLRQHFLFGSSFCFSDLYWKLEQHNSKLILKDIGVSYEPISLRRVWINHRLPLWDMELQPCPFFYTLDMDAHVANNTYDPESNPFGFVNQAEALKQDYAWFGTLGESEEWKTLEERLGAFGQGLANLQTTQQTKVRAEWHFYPMLPLDPQTGEWKVRGDGSPVPYKRFAWEHYGHDIISSKIIPLRLQDISELEHIPLSGTSHVLDLDAGAYTIAICEFLLDYYIEISTCMNQFVENKNLVNNPPSTYMVGSPAGSHDYNRAGSKTPVLGEKDVQWRQVYDATMTSVNMLEHLRTKAQTTGKTVDAIMGKAMGSRTTATEANNAFQAAMSGATTDINLFNYQDQGSYAIRSFKLMYKFMDSDLITLLSGVYGIYASKEQLNSMFSLKFDVGSTFVESIFKQEQIRYMIEAAMRSPSIDQTELWNVYAEEVRMPELKRAILDNGFRKQQGKAQLQACKTFMNEQVIIDPNQDHNIAIETKMAILEDQNSGYEELKDLPYLETGRTRAQAIADQIGIHQQFAMLQMMREQQMMMSQMIAGGGALSTSMPPGPGVPSLPGQAPETPGQKLNQVMQ